ncbi:MAG: cold shock domain-containing protein [Acidimicrobiia bacterium]|nr:cold shock domain-containing protein [Acidimicrobiia bacterium]
MTPDGRLEGVVEAYDDDRGWGTVRTAGDDTYFFHCTAIADGSRTIRRGAAVGFTLVAGHRGRFEARDLRPLEPSG